MINTINGVDILIVPLENLDHQNIQQDSVDQTEGIQQTSVASKLRENTKDFLEVVNLLASSFGELNSKIKSEFCPDEIEVAFAMGATSNVNLWAISAKGTTGINVKFKWSKKH
jgi:hypothetical protein